MESFRSSSVNAQSVSCSIVIGWKRSDILVSLRLVRLQAGVQASGLLACLRPDFLGVDAGRFSVLEHNLAVNLHLERAYACSECDVPRIHRVIGPGDLVVASFGYEVPAPLRAMPMRDPGRL